MMYERFEKGGKTMNTLECIKTRRSIRKFKPDPVDHATLEFLIGAASYSPSWKVKEVRTLQGEIKEEHPYKPESFGRSEN